MCQDEAAATKKQAAIEKRQSKDLAAQKKKSVEKAKIKTIADEKQKKLEDHEAACSDGPVRKHCRTTRRTVITT